MSYQQQLLDRIFHIQNNGPSRSVASLARTVIADAMAVRRLHPAATKASTLFEDTSEASWANIQQLAFRLAEQIHGQDFDDSHDASMLHCAAPVIAPSFAYCYLRDLTLDDLISAVIIGYETLTFPFRLGMKVDRGAFPTISYGALGTSGALMALQEFDRQEFAQGLSLAASACGGAHSRQIMEHAPHLKVAQILPSLAAGFAAGQRSSLINFTTTHWLTGEYGLIPEAPNSPSVLQGWGIEEISFKLFPTVRYSHGSIEAVIELLKLVSAKDIDRIDIQLPARDTQGRKIYHHAGQPWDATNRDWSSYSIPWLVAAVVTGGADSMIHQTLSQSQREEIASLATRVRVYDDLQNSPNGLIPVSMTAYDHHGEILDSVFLNGLQGSVKNAPKDSAWLRKLGYCHNGNYHHDDGQQWLDIWKAPGSTPIRQIVQQI